MRRPPENRKRRPAGNGAALGKILKQRHLIDGARGPQPQEEHRDPLTMPFSEWLTELFDGGAR